MTPEEVSTISNGIEDHIKRARFLMKYLQVFNKTIVFSVTEKSYKSVLREQKNLLVFYEKAIIPI